MIPIMVVSSNTLFGERSRERQDSVTVTLTVPRFTESGQVARRLGVSLTWLHELGAELGLPTERTVGGRRLWTEAEIEAIQRMREERQASRLAGREARAA